MLLPGSLLLLTLSVGSGGTSVGSHRSLAHAGPVARPSLGRPSSVTNLGVALRFTQPFLFADPGAMVGPRFVALQVEESAQGASDLNGDGDTKDTVLHVWDRAAGSLRNVGLAVDPDLLTFAAAGTIAAVVPESGVDLNGDGDGSDRVLHLVDARTGAVDNLRLTVPGFFQTPTQNRVREQAGTFAIELLEDGLDDWNGDGDRTDVVVALGLLGGRAGLSPRVAGVARLAASPLLATGDQPSADGTQMALDRDFLLVGVDEIYEGGTDLNGDGDAVDFGILHLVDARTGATRNLGISANFSGLGDGFAAFRSPESSDGVDANRDGDLADEVLHCADTTSGAVENLGLAVTGVYVNGGVAAGLASEAAQGLDLNGDGDTLDSVPFVHVHATGETRLLPLAALEARPVGTRVVVLASEAAQGADLNGDGDQLDEVLHTWPVAGGVARSENVVVQQGTMGFGPRFADVRVSEAQNGADLNGDGDTLDRVVFVYDGVLDTLSNLAVSTFAVQQHRESGPYLLLPALEFQDGTDYNGDGDTTDVALLILDAASGTLVNPGLAIFGLGVLDDLGVRGDAALVLVSESNQGGADLNGDGDTNDSKVAFLVTLP